MLNILYVSAMAVDRSGLEVVLFHIFKASTAPVFKPLILLLEDGPFTHPHF